MQDRKYRSDPERRYPRQTQCLERPHYPYWIFLRSCCSDFSDLLESSDDEQEESTVQNNDGLTTAANEEQHHTGYEACVE
ncbi:hypothetical protein M8J76_001655 [Diaphorina citri]|nr:hypothetical protein M8J75_000832 [Diaphorina citri]KAI5729346.1 hypothetical protein M8J76_001655 [Diaphorina citri]